MSSEQIALILKSFEAPDEVRVMQKGRFEIVHVGGMTVGRATMSRVGNGASTSGRAWVRPGAMLNTLA